MMEGERKREGRLENSGLFMLASSVCGTSAINTPSLPEPSR